METGIGETAADLGLASAERVRRGFSDVWIEVMQNRGDTAVHRCLQEWRTFRRGLGGRERR